MKTPFACVFNKIRRLNPCFLKWRDCVSMKCFYCQIKITFLKRLLPWFGFYCMRRNSLWILSFLVGRLQCYQRQDIKFYPHLYSFLHVDREYIWLVWLSFTLNSFFSRLTIVSSGSILKGHRNMSVAFLYIYINHVFLRISYHNHLKNTQFYE